MNAHYFEKENKSTQGYLVFCLPVRGRPDIYLPKYKQEEKVFMIINLLSLICGLIRHVDDFFMGNNPTQGFLITLAFQSVGDTKSDFSLTEG